MKAFALLCSALILAASASRGEDDKRGPLERYRADTAMPLVMCKIKMQMADAKGKAYEQQDETSDFLGCIRDGKAKANASLAAALKTVKGAKAVDALKSYHVAFSTALDGLLPGADERRISYEVRQKALDGKVTEAWARFEVER